MNDERRDEFSEAADGAGEYAPAAEPETDEKPKKKHPLRRVLAAVLVLIAAAGGLLVYAQRGRLSGADDAASGSAMTDFAYENGSDQTFAAVGDGLAVASASGVQLLDERGDTVFREVCSMDTPAVAGSKQRAVFYDVGGSTCIVADLSGESTQPEIGGAVMSASVSDSGYFAVISEETGSKGLVQVFDSSCRLLYKWYSGTGYPLRAQVSPDNTRLAVLCVDGTGSRIHVFRLTSEDEQALIEYPGELLCDMYFMGASTLCAIGSSGAHFFGLTGEKLGEYSFGGRYLAAYDLGSQSFAAICLSDYRAGAGGTLVTLGADGTELGRCEISGDLISLSASGKQLLAATTDVLTLYSQALEEVSREDALITAKQALLRPKGDVLLLSLYSAERFSF